MPLLSDLLSQVTTMSWSSPPWKSNFLLLPFPSSSCYGLRSFCPHQFLPVFCLRFLCHGWIESIDVQSKRRTEEMKWRRRRRRHRFGWQSNQPGHYRTGRFAGCQKTGRFGRSNPSQMHFRSDGSNQAGKSKNPVEPDRTGRSGPVPKTLIKRWHWLWFPRFTPFKLHCSASFQSRRGVVYTPTQNRKHLLRLVFISKPPKFRISTSTTTHQKLLLLFLLRQ